MKIIEIREGHVSFQEYLKPGSHFWSKRKSRRNLKRVFTPKNKQAQNQMQEKGKSFFFLGLHLHNLRLLVWTRL